MKIAVISDIHSNPRALRRVINSAKKLGCERFICCGDIVGYGYGPNECIEMCRENNVECIKGNHDAALIGELSLDWFNQLAAIGIVENRPLVSEENKCWLAGLPYQIKESLKETNVVFSHGSYTYPDEFGYIDDHITAKIEMDKMRANSVDAIFVGHTHGPGWYFRTISSEAPFKFDEPPRGMKDKKCLMRHWWSESIINVGSVGYPRRCRFSTYAIIDTDTFNVEMIRLPFDYVDYRKRLIEQGRFVPVWIEARIAFVSHKKASE